MEKKRSRNKLGRGGGGGGGRRHHVSVKGKEKHKIELVADSECYWDDWCAGVTEAPCEVLRAKTISKLISADRAHFNEKLNVLDFIMISC